MTTNPQYSDRERFWLTALAVVSLFAINGVFLYAVFFRPDQLRLAMTNPVALAFIVEALLLTGALAYLLRRWRVAHLSAGWFIVLALAGGLAFALPVVLLWRNSTRDHALKG
jgi:uncharacterized membrane protein YhaH (DUF805 family)